MSFASLTVEEVEAFQKHQVESELSALKEIYSAPEDGLEIIHFVNSAQNDSVNSRGGELSLERVKFAVRLDVMKTRLSFACSKSYPSSRPPVVAILNNSSHGHYVNSLNSIAREEFLKGEPCLYQIIEACKNFVIENSLAEDGDVTEEIGDLEHIELNAMDLGEDSGFEFVQDKTTKYKYRRLDADQNKDLDNEFDIFHGEIVHYKKSAFQAHLAFVKTNADAMKVYEILKHDKRLAKATHNIMAYRLYDTTKDIYRKDNDDDGETAAGSRLALLLDMVDAKNVVVVVSRWFGGTLLGPIRFKLINNVARDLITERCQSSASINAE